MIAMCLASLAAPSAAQDKSVAGELPEPVRITTTREAALVGPLLTLFGRLTNVAVDVAYVTGDPLPRLRADVAAGRSDVFIASELGQLVAAKAAGLTDPVTDAELLAAVPVKYRDPEGHWIGLTRRMRVVVVAADRVPAGELTYDALAGPNWKGRLCVRSGHHPYNVSLTASILARKGADQAEAWLRGLKANLARPPHGGDRDQLFAVLDGVCDAALVNTYYVAGVLAGRSDRAADLDRLRVIFPDRNGNGSHVSLSGMAQMRSARDRRDVRLLMDFLLSRPAQFVYAQDNLEYPVRSDVRPERLLSRLGTPAEDTIAIADWTGSIAAAADLVRKVDFDAKGPSQ